MEKINAYSVIKCNEKCFLIYTQTKVGSLNKDPLGEEFYFDLNVDLKTLGEAVVKALAKSRDLSMSEETRKQFAKICDTDGVLEARKWLYQKFPEWKLFDNELCVERYNEWVKEIIKRCKTKTKAATFRNMQYVDIEKNSTNIKIFSWLHERSDGWTLDDPNNNITIPSKSSLEVIGAAVKYAIGNCRGKGSDLIRSLLFPNGQPETFEKYIEELGIG